MRRVFFVFILFFTSFSLGKTAHVYPLISAPLLLDSSIADKDPCSIAEHYQSLANTESDSQAYYQQMADRFLDTCTQHSSSSPDLLLLAESYVKLGNYEQAQKQYSAALNTFIRQKDTLNAAHCYKGLGVIHQRTNRYSKALHFLNIAANYYHILNEKSGKAVIELNIGLVLKKIGRLQSAKAYYHNALSIYQELNDHVRMGDCLNNLGNVHKAQNNLDSAFYYMYQTLSLRQRFGPNRKLAFIYHNLADLHLLNGNYDSTVWYLNQSIPIKQRLGNKKSLASDYFSFGILYKEQGNYAAAVSAFSKVRELNQDETLSDIDYMSSLELGHAHYQLKNYKAAARNYAFYFWQKDSVKAENDLFEIQNELIKYDFFKDSIAKEQLLIKQQLEEAQYRNRQMANESTKRNFYFVFGILTLLIVMLSLLFISYRKQLRQTREHRQILAAQNEELKRTLVSKEEKETLLKEIHHRVKNNLQIISSLIRLQSGYINQNNFQERLNEIENRILSMALIHEKLYRSKNLAKLEINDYIKELCINILESYENNCKVDFKFDIDPIEVSIDTLIPIGLILNESISNSLKHAFSDREQGLVTVSLKNTILNETIIIVKDNGIGADLSVGDLKEDSLGMELIFSLTEQLDGTVTINTDKGFKYTFKFPKLG